MASELPSHKASLTISSTEKARNYIQSREIPQLFEALMTGLMFKQPDDHIEYIINCLHRVKHLNNNNNSNKQLANIPLKQNNPPTNVKWNTFLTDLPTVKENAEQQHHISKEARVLSGNKK